MSTKSKGSITQLRNREYFEIGEDILGANISLVPSGQNGVVPLEFLPAVIVANTPQMILSFTYFAYNAFITRSVSEMEWNSYALSYKGLRVTDPRGEQVSTYRLQLPYSYSIPLVIASILLHWFMSNIMFAVIVEGGKTAFPVPLPYGRH